MTIEKEAVDKLVDEIRGWELEAGESYTDYFFDRYSYDGKWLEFLELKGFAATAKEVREDVYVYSDGTKSKCTDQQLKFEPYSEALAQANNYEGQYWNEDTYRLDVALWAEYILLNERILAAHKEFLAEYFEGDDD